MRTHTHTGQLEIYRRTPGYPSNPDGALVSGHATASGNARQRRKVIRGLKRQGWTVYSCLRTGVRRVSVVER